MASIIATVTPAPIGLGRAILLIAASLLLHALVLSVMRDGLVGPPLALDIPTRTIDAALIVDVPPPAPPSPRRVVPKRPPRPKPPPAAPAPAAVAESAPAVVASAEPPRSAPGEG